MGIVGNLRALGRTSLPLVALLAATALAAPAAASTISGQAPGKIARLGGKPVGQVLAVDPAKARPVAGGPYESDGGYKLEVPKGVYLIVAPITGADGKPVSARSRIFRIKTGQRKSVRLTKKSPKRKRKKGSGGRRSSASPAAGQLIKVSVHGSTLRGGGLDHLGPAVDSILVTDLFTAKRGLDCPVEVYVDRKSADFRAIEQEIAFQQTAYANPNTRVTPLYDTARYAPKVRITAELRADGAALTGTISARKISSGKVLATASVNRDLTTLLEGFPSELRDLLERLCDPAPPPEYSGSVAGTAGYDESEVGPGNHLAADWSGSVVLRELEAEYPPGYPPGFGGGPIAYYALASGSIHYSFSGRAGDCDVAGEGPIDLGAQPDYKDADLLDLFEDDADERSYRFQIPMPVSVLVPGTRSNCKDPEDNGKSFDWVPAAGVPWLVSAPLPGGPVGADWSLSGSGSGNNGPGSPDQTWQWSLSPSS